jgi:vancomycin aglycone glucosyltransferase
MRIAMAADGTRGDIHPLLALGARFRAGGHDVLICAPPNFRDDAEAHELEFAPVGLDTRVFLNGHARAVTQGGSRILLEMKAYSDRVLEDQLERVPELARGADRIFAAGVQAGASVAAAIHGIPYRFIVYCPALIPSPELTPLMLPTRPRPPWVNRPAWWLTRWSFRRLMLGRINARLVRDGAHPASDAVDFVLGPRPILAADAELAPAPLEPPVAVEQIPCLHPFAGPPLPEKLRNFLDAGVPPVYLGFGSMTDPDPTSSTRVLLEAVRRAGVRAVISGGWAGLADGALPDGVFATGPVAHAHLFPRVAAVVHHGGAGTTTMAARAGVPQILIPHVLDQHYWSSRVTRLGLGPPPISRHRLTAPKLEQALVAIMDNDVLRDRTSELGERLRGLASTAPDPENLLRG